MNAFYWRVSCEVARISGDLWPRVEEWKNT